MTVEHTASRPEDAPSPSWSSRCPHRAAIAYVIAYLAVAAAGGALVVRIPSPAGKAALVTAAATAALALSLFFVLAICRLPLRARAEVAWIVAMTVVFCLTRPVMFAILGKFLGYPVAGKQLASLLPALPGQQLLGNAALIAWAAFLGKLVSRIIREGKLLFPVAVVAALADIITVFWGPVAAVSENAPEVAEAFSATAPVAPPPEVAAPILAAVGIGDFLFLALFLAAALRHAMPAVRTMWAVFVLMLLAPLAFLIPSEGYGIPGLPFISAAALWANWRHLRFTPEEKKAMVLSAVLVAAVAAGLWVAFHR